MIEKGIVSDLKDGKLIISTRRRSACGSCKACGMKEGRDMSLELDNTIDARVGDIVNIELDDLVILKGTFLFYGVPLVGLMAGLFLGKILFEKVKAGVPTELLATLLGFFFMIMAYLAVKRRGSFNNKRYKPKVVKS